MGIFDAERKDIARRKRNNKLLRYAGALAGGLMAGAIFVFGEAVGQREGAVACTEIAVNAFEPLAESALSEGNED